MVIANRRYAEMYGISPDLLQEGTSLQRILEARARAGLYDTDAARRWAQDGRLNAHKEAADSIPLSDGRLVCVVRRQVAGGGLVSTHEDVTERERLREQLDTALNNMSQGMAMFDAELRLVVANRRYAEIYGLAPAHLRPGTPLRELMERRVARDEHVAITQALSDGLIPEQLIRNRDLALYRAKGDGRGTFRFFAAEMDVQMQARRTLEQDLRKALIAGELELHYQPVITIASGKISGLEVLVRWQHPADGLVSPATFIPLAEEAGLIVPIGEWVIRQAGATAAQWPADLRIAVNLSPAQLRNPCAPADAGRCAGRLGIGA